MENQTISILNDYYGELLTERQKEMIGLFYDCDMSLGEIAEQFSVSRQAVRDAIQRGEKSLLEFEEKLKLFKRAKTLNETADELLKKLEAEDVKGARAAAEKIKSLLEE